jgi:hypothetical protein
MDPYNLAPTSLFRSKGFSKTCSECNNLYQQHYSDQDITWDKDLCISCINQIYDGRIFQKKLLSLNNDNTPKIYFGREEDGSSTDINDHKYILNHEPVINCVKNILIRNNFEINDDSVYTSLDSNDYLRLYVRIGEDLYIVKYINHLEENYPGIGLLNINEIN